MSDNKKNLLNESQIRQFMKLASLQPLTPGFVSGLSETTKGEKTKRGTEAFRGMKKGEKSEEHPGEEDDTAKKEKEGQDLRKGAKVRGAEGTKGKEGEGDAFVDVKSEAVEDLDELRTGRTGALGPKNGTANPGHGRGQGEAADGSLFEAEADPEALEDYAAGDLERGHPEEAEADELEADAELDADAVDVGDVEGDGPTLTVQQVVAAIEDALQDLLPNEEVSAEYVADEPEVDVEAEEEFAPEGDDVVADIEVGEEELEEVLGFGKSKEEKEQEKKDIEDLSVTSAKRTAYDKKTGGSGAQKIGRPSRYSVDSSAATYKESNENTDDLVEQITKRVAARILKSALTKK